MPNEELVRAVKQGVAHFRGGNLGAGYASFRDLISSREFVTYRPEDQRQALRLMILLKNAPSPPSELMLEAHRAAIAPLVQLVDDHGEPSDYELLGICYVLIGDERSAEGVFRTGLSLERNRNSGSDLCGSLMKRLSFL